MSTLADSTASTIEGHDAYLSPNYGRFPMAIVSGAGSTLRDAEGKAYLDLFAGFGAPVLGHCHPDLVRAVTEQANTLWHVGNLLHTGPQVRAAEAIHRHGFGGVSFFCHSGADANEAAIKLARLYGKARRGASTGEHGRYKIVSCNKSFHGRSFATMCATAGPAVRAGFEPHLPGYTNVPYNDLTAVEAAVDDETVAVLAEPIQGEGGINVPDPDYFRGLRALCDERDLLLICDEVWTGCGRTGKYFAHQHWLDEDSGGPDVMTLGKGVGGGLAVGVMCARPEVADYFNAKTQGGVKHATTLGGNCLSMAVTATIFEVLERDGLVARAAKLGERAATRLRRFAEGRPAVRDVRGLGLFLGIELDPDADDAWFGSARDVVLRCLDAGLMINGTAGGVLRIAPPLTITDDELDRGLSILEEVLAS
ncbi:MAG: aminotransferase class III-fold pyridoxal phosphate-dependent enzyme [Planctomycetota bacterium]